MPEEPPAPSLRRRRLLAVLSAACVVSAVLWLAARDASVRSLVPEEWRACGADAECVVVADHVDVPCSCSWTAMNKGRLGDYKALAAERAAAFREKGPRWLPSAIKAQLEPPCPAVLCERDPSLAPRCMGGQCVLLK